MDDDESVRIPDRWVRLRFAIIGQLLAVPARGHGELRRAIQSRAAQTWRHRVTGAPVKFAFSTIEKGCGWQGLCGHA